MLNSHSPHSPIHYLVALLFSKCFTCQFKRWWSWTKNPQLLFWNLHWNSKISIQCSSSGIEMAQRCKKYFSNAVEACRKTGLQSRRFKNIHGMGKAFRLVFTQNVMFPRKSWLLENIDISKILTVRNQSPKN